MPLPGTPLSNVGPGVLKDFHYKFLGQLASKGILDGYWLKQEQLAKKGCSKYENQSWERILKGEEDDDKEGIRAYL